MAQVIAGWIGVDFDRTLATYDGQWRDGSLAHHRPVPAMVERVRRWLDSGIEVRIVTARVADESVAADQRARIGEWLREHVGMTLDIQSGKDRFMTELWDDSVVAVERNTGRRLSPSAIEHDVNSAPVRSESASVVEILLKHRPDLTRGAAEVLLQRFLSGEVAP